MFYYDFPMPLVVFPNNIRNVFWQPSPISFPNINHLRSQPFPTTYIFPQNGYRAIPPRPTSSHKMVRPRRWHSTLPTASLPNVSIHPFLRIPPLISHALESFCTHRRSTSCIMGFRSYPTIIQPQVIFCCNYSVIPTSENTS